MSWDNKMTPKFLKNNPQAQAEWDAFLARKEVSYYGFEVSSLNTFIK
jgi:hypothetical protein